MECKNPLRQRFFSCKTALITDALSKYNIDIAALIETRFAGTSQLEEVSAGYTFFLIGKSEEDSCLSGVGFVIELDIAKSLSSLLKGINDDITTLVLELNNNSSAPLVSCYTPTMNTPVLEIDDFYDQLQSFLKFHIETNLSLWETLMHGLVLTIRHGLVSLALTGSGV